MVKVRKVKGSSIIEVVVGLFIISLSIALTGVLFAKLFNSSSRMLKQRVWHHVNQVANDVHLNQNVEALAVDHKNYTIARQTELIDEKKGLWKIRIVAHDKQEQELVSRRFIMEINQVKNDE